MSEEQFTQLWDVLVGVRERLAGLEKALELRPRPCEQLRAHLQEHSAEGHAMEHTRDRWWNAAIRLGTTAAAAAVGAILAMLAGE